MSSSGAATLDLVPIRSAQHAARCALRKREREGREARRAVVAARGVAAQMLAAQAQAAQVLKVAQQEHRRSVAACNSVGQPSTATPLAGGSDLMALVRYCERVAFAVKTRHAELQDAEHAVAQAHAHVDTCSRTWSRLEQRASQVREQLGAWVVREQVAIEMHGDQALEDEPHRPVPGARR